MQHSKNKYKMKNKLIYQLSDHPTQISFKHCFFVSQSWFIWLKMTLCCLFPKSVPGCGMLLVWKLTELCCRHSKMHVNVTGPDQCVNERAIKHNNHNNTPTHNDNPITRAAHIYALRKCHLVVNTLYSIYIYICMCATANKTILNKTYVI